MVVYIMRTGGVIGNVWHSLADATEHMKLVGWELVHESRPDRRYMSDWSQLGMNGETMIASLDAHEVIGFPTEAHVVGHTGGSDANTR